MKQERNMYFETHSARNTTSLVNPLNLFMGIPSALCLQHSCLLKRLFPKSELYGLTSQIRRSSVSVASNIAEGYGRRSKQEYIQFLHIALGSLRELDTQFIIAKEVDLAEKELFTPLLNEVEEMQSILVATLNKIKD